MVTHDYDRRVQAAGNTYRELLAELIETLRQLKVEHGADLKVLGQQATRAAEVELGMKLADSRVQRQPYHKLYFRLVELLKAFRIRHDMEPKIIYQQALDALKREHLRP